MKTTYMVTRTRIFSEEMEVEADSEDEAIEYANNQPDHFWTDNGGDTNYEAVLIHYDLLTEKW